MQDNTQSASLGELFELRFFPTLVCAYCSDADVIRLHACNRFLHDSLSEEVCHIKRKRKGKRIENQCLNQEVEIQVGKFLIWLVFAILKACLCGNARPLTNFVANMSFGSHGCHVNSVGFSTLQEIFDMEEIEIDEHDPWFY